VCDPLFLRFALPTSFSSPILCLRDNAIAIYDTCRCLLMFNVKRTNFKKYARSVQTECVNADPLDPHKFCVARSY